MTGTSPLRVQLLGPLRAWHGDNEIKLGSGGRQAVFTVLATHVNETVSRAELVDAVWDDEPPAKAVGILHTYIHDLRRALEPGRDKRADSTVLATVQSSYSLMLPEEQLDERLFARHHEQAQRYWAAGDLSTAVGELDAALALWHGEALHGVPGRYAEMQRARLAESRITAVERRSALLLIRGGAHERVIGELTELVAGAPSRESARGLLMAALNQAGRRAEAVELYRDTERALLDEQGIEPSPALRRIHQYIRDGQPVAADAISAGVWTVRHDTERAVTPTHTLAEERRPTPPPFLVGRDDEVAWLRSLLRDLLDGRGDCVGVEGAQGVGKTALISTVFAEPDDAYTVFWGSLTGAADCLGDRVVPFVEQVCATRPLVFIVDDMHAVDDCGLLVWHRLAHLTQQLPLLLLGVFRTRPHPGRLRGAIGATGGRVKTIGPLSFRNVVELAQRRLDALCGPQPRELLDAAAGNPLFANELLDTMTDARALCVAAGFADLSPEYQAQPRTVLRQLTKSWLSVLTPGTQQMVRSAALLGARFELGDLAVLMHTSPTDLVTAVEEAVVAGTLDDSGQRLAFRSTVLAKVLVEELHPALRAALHREAAEALATAGVPADRVATQLLAAAPVDTWSVRWVLDNVDAVATRDQATAFRLLDHAIAGAAQDVEQYDALAVHRVQLAFRLGKRPRDEAEAILATTNDPQYAATMRWVLANLDYQSGAVDKAIGALRAAERDTAVPAPWRARFEALRAQFEGGLDDLGAAEQAASTVLRHATNASDPTATMFACAELWFMATARRDHQAALAHTETALEVIQNSTNPVHWQLSVLENRAVSLQNLDRLDEATHTLTRMRYIGDRTHPPAGRPHVMTAAHDYWLGRWDEALARLDLVTPADGGQAYDLGDHTPLLLHGVAALIAAQRGDTRALRTHLAAAEAHPLVTGREQENSDFLVVARAMDAGVRADAAAELAALDPLLDLTYGRITLRHQWLPRIMRLALDSGDQDRVAAVSQVCEFEAAREVRPARAHAARQWCQALAGRDPDVLLGVARHYRQAGRTVEMAAALADAAVAFAEHRQASLAELTFIDALAVLAELGATSDITRATARLRDHGVTGVDLPVNRPLFPGWGSLSGLERLIAQLAAAGTPNPEIAAELALSRRDVQGYLSGAMRKLGVESRAGLVDKIRSASS